MEAIKFINATGEIIDFYNPPFHLSAIEGLGDVEADIQTQQSPFQDGTAFLDARLNMRFISLTLRIEGKNYEDVKSLRSEIGRKTSPKLGLGTLQYRSGNVIREIKAVAQSVPYFPPGRSNRGANWQKASLVFQCPNPYWRSLEVTEEPAFEPLFQFPFEGEFQMGIQRDQRIIDNDGDSPAPLFIEFFGPAINPRIINNTTGEFFKVNQTLAEGEVMEIDTEKATVFFVEPDGTRRNVFNWIDDDAEFFKLAIGQNDIEYTADSDIQGAIVNISYSKLYTAV